MIRFLLSTVAYLIANAVGLLVAVLLLPGFTIDPLAFIIAVAVFSRRDAAGLDRKPRGLDPAADLRLQGTGREGAQGLIGRARRPVTQAGNSRPPSGRWLAGPNPIPFEKPVVFAF